MNFNISILADQLLQYAEYIGTAISRNSKGIVTYEIDNYMLDGNKISIHYDIAFEGDKFLRRVEVTKV